MERYKWRKLIALTKWWWVLYVIWQVGMGFTLYFLLDSCYAGADEYARDSYDRAGCDPYFILLSHVVGDLVIFALPAYLVKKRKSYNYQLY